MFSGIVETIGRVSRVERSVVDRIQVAVNHSHYANLELGASVAVNGCCLTVTRHDGNGGLSFELGDETKRLTSLGTLEVGSRVNLERAVAADGRFDGHLVSGHIDCLGTITSKRHSNGLTSFEIGVDERWAPHLVYKGSVAVDGVSLTVNYAGVREFGISLLPYTVRHTIFGAKEIGDLVHIEFDLFGKYVLRSLELGRVDQRALEPDLFNTPTTQGGRA